MLEQIKTNYHKVEHILKTCPDTRDNDQLLYLEYLREFKDLGRKIGNNNFDILKYILLHKDTASMESITRARRKIQEKGIYQSNKKEKRRKNEKEIKNFFQIWKE